MSGCPVIANGCCASDGSRVAPESTVLATAVCGVGLVSVANVSVGVGAGAAAAATLIDGDDA